MRELDELREIAQQAKRRDALIARAVKKGASYRRVAEAAGITAGRVAQILKRATTLALVLLMVPVAGEAKAHHFKGLDRAQAVAEKFWADRGLEPCAPAEIPASHGQHSTSPEAPAWARSPKLDPRWPCRIDFSAAIHSVVRFDDLGVWATQCSILVHEYGHLAGLGHEDADRYPIMRGGRWRIPADCAEADKATRPVNVTRPHIVKRRGQLRCKRGGWQRAESFKVRWFHRGWPASRRWTIRPWRRGRVKCEITATNGYGPTTAGSASYRWPGRRGARLGS